MILEEIFAQYGVKLLDENGNLRDVIDVIEDMYLKLSVREIQRIMMEISDEEKYSNIFDAARNRKYRGVKNED
jgi:predicted secreted protein